ncbi:MAG: hypothetical protein JO250_21665 [Armatimonadetes bacterium]|nr:hypothetical protein [Armatimonadota bacterium]
MMAQKHSRRTERGRCFWLTERLWERARGLPVKRVPLESISELDRDCWFCGNEPTIRAVADHARRIQEADLSHPIILSADGGLMDGGHRLAKAWLLGMTEIAAVQFDVDPEPDWIEPEKGESEP